MRSTQEDLLVIGALVEYHWDQLSEQPNRACHAKVLANRLAREHGLPIEDALWQWAVFE